MIRFLLNQQLIETSPDRADLTILDYLRHRKQLYGTKEGCASGDCGACTVVLGEVHKDRINYSHINSCITLLGSLHGKQLLTVEHLQRGQQLHPAQEALVTHHGSQCGFCTPGFVMSLFALVKDHQPVRNSTQRKQKIEEYLGGNLCRCTGYRPIIDAAVETLTTPQTDQFETGRRDTIKKLQTIQAMPDAGSDIFHIPASIDQLCTLIEHYPEARLSAGATDLALEITQQLSSIKRIILLTQVVELTRITEHDTQYEVGAAVSLTRVQALLARQYPDTRELLLRFGSRQIRNQGTIGGNIANASPIGDLPPVLIALGATLVLQQGTHQRTIDAEAYFIDYKVTALGQGEFIRSVRIPKADKDHVLKIHKISKRLDDDISTVCVAFHVAIKDNRFESVRVAFGGMAAVPKRARHLETALRGKPVHTDTIAFAQQALESDFQPISDARASAGYRIQVAQNLLHRLYLELTAPHTPCRVTHHA